MKRLVFGQGVATLSGAIIGAGMLGLPFAVMRAGVGPGILLIVVLGAMALTLNLMFGEIVLRTNLRHQITGYVRNYLGNGAYALAIVTMLIGGFGVLTAYIIGEGQALAALFGGPSFFYSLVFWLVMAALTFFGLRLFKAVEIWLVMIFLVVILVILGLSLPAVYPSHWGPTHWNQMFSPYGVILFAFGGTASVVPLREILRKQSHRVKRAVIAGTVIPLVIYILFVLVIVGVTGKHTTEVATVGLGNVLAPYMLILGNVFAVFALGTGFLCNSLVLRELFQFDFKSSRWLAWGVTILVPLILFFASSRDFIQAMGLTGGVAFGLTGSLIVWTYWRAKKKGNRIPEYSLPVLRWPGGILIALYLSGVVWTVWQFLH